MSSTDGKGPSRFDLPDGTALIALHDGVFRAPVSALRDNAGEEATKALQAASGAETRLDVNCFALLRDEGVVLIDCGTGSSWGDALGHAMSSLASLGLGPEKVATVLLTHFHGDHVLGLFDAAGEFRFPGSDIWCSRVDHDAFRSDERRAAAPEDRRGTFDLACRVFDAAGSRLRLFDEGEVLPGIEAVPLPGHTPGHSGFLIGSLLLVTGDVFQLSGLQGTRPSVGLVYDADPVQAERTRRDCLETAAARSWLVAGSHIPFPGVVTIGETADGYRFEPFDEKGPADR